MVMVETMCATRIQGALNAITITSLAASTVSDYTLSGIVSEKTMMALRSLPFREICLIAAEIQNFIGIGLTALAGACGTKIVFRRKGKAT